MKLIPSINYRIKFLQELGGWNGQPESDIAMFREKSRPYFEKTISNNSFIAYLAKSANEIVGIGCLVVREQPGNFKNPDGKVGYLMNMYTIPEFRGKGICTSILNALFADAFHLGIHFFELHATKKGEGVYVRSGFIIHREPTYRKFISTDVDL